MKILYAIQGTGNGHLARALDVYPTLCAYGEVDVLVSGIQGDINLPFPVKYKLHGLSFIFGKHGGIDKWATARRMNLAKFISDIFRLPIQQYDLVVNDFEAVSAWACRLHKKPCISLSHQAAVLHHLAPKPKQNGIFGRWMLQNYAPTTAAYGFHFKQFDQNTFTPIIRNQIRELQISDEGHYTVYLPSYDDNTLVKELSVFETIHWQIFSKHCKEAFSFKNIHVQPIANNNFINSMASSTGVLCGAGFETPAEALYLGKKLLVIPMKDQYEQQCNAACLSSIGVPTLESLSKKHRSLMTQWLAQKEIVSVNYPDNVQMVVAKLIEAHWASVPKRFRFAQ